MSASLVETQALLARLYTDENMLQAFLSDPDAFSREHAGNEALLHVDRERLRFFAHSLRSKREREAHKLLPLLSTILGPRFTELFHRYAAQVLPSGVKKHIADAMAFCSWLRQKEDAEAMIVEAAEYERVRFQIHFVLKQRRKQPGVYEAAPRRGPFLKLVRFSYDLPCSQESPHFRSTWTLFARLPGLEGIWYW